MYLDRHERRATDNIVLEIGGLNSFVSIEVQNSTSVLRLNFSAKIPPIAKLPNRWRSL
ncbi:MAG: hypothetical protein J0G96_11625 [Flavobacteriia bacterium]|nr:hypothetical protein [Flavobacteriia bacterium]